MAFSPEQLSFFKFSSVVLDEFPVALRQVFIRMWDTRVASPPGVPKWDDSVTVLNIFLAREGGAKKVPMLNKSSKEWDCTALFKASLFSQTFAMPDRTGVRRTLHELYVRPCSLPPGAFHPSVISPIGNLAETYALASDQLRLLRNAHCHSLNTKEMDKVTFDRYITLAKEALTAFGQSTTKIDEIGSLGEEDFPTSRTQQLEDELKREKNAAIKFRQIDDHLNKIESQVKDLNTEVLEVQTGMKDVESDVKDLRTDMSEVKIGLKHYASVITTKLDGVCSNMKTRVEAVRSGVKDLNTPLEDIHSDLKGAKTGVTDVKMRVEDVLSEVKDVKAQTADVESLASGVMELKANVACIKEVLQAEKSTGPPFPESCIPDKIPHFVGRKEESRNILDQLTDGSTRLVDVWGPPGFGKTSVAIHVAHELRERKIPVYFTSLRGLKTRDDLVSNLLGIFEDAKEALHVSPSDRLIQCLRKWRSPLVLILDNADDLLESRDTQVRQDVLRLIEELRVKCNHINLLVTSRESHKDLSHKLPIHLERVGVLDEASSAELVKTLLPKVSESDRNCIMKECGKVPLAMRLMCSIIEEGTVSVGELLEELKNSPLIEILDNESNSDDCRLKKIMNTSFQRLTSNQQEAFVSLAVFPGCFGVDEAKAVLNLKTVFEAKKILQSLKRKSLVDCSDNFDNFTIHSLLRSFVEDRRRKEEEIQRHYAEAQLRFCIYYISKFREANEKFLTGSSNDAYKAFHNQRENIRLALVDGSKDEDLYSKVVEVLSKAELFVYAVLPNQEALFDILYSTAIEEAKKRQRRDDECKLLAAKSFSSLGGFYSRPRSWDHSLESGDQNAENPPPKYLVYLGIHQLLSRNIDDGISSLRASVNHLGNDNDERILKILAYHVLAVCYRKKMDKVKVSEFETLCAKECELSSCCPAFLNLFLQNSHQLLEVEICCENDLVNVIEKDVFFFVVMAELLPLLYTEVEFDQHMVTELPLMTSHLKRFQKVILKLFDEGILHTRVLEACCNALYNLMCYQEAAEGFQRITDRLKVLGSTNRSAYRAYLFRGLALSELDNYEEALHCYKETMAIAMEHLDETRREGIYDITNVIEALEQLSNCLHMQRCLNETATVNQTDDFKSTFEKLKSIVQSELVNVGSKNHDELATCLKTLADCQVSMRNLAEALDSFQQAITIREKYCDDQAKLASCLLSKGNAYFEVKNYTEAIKVHQSALNLGILNCKDTAIIHCHLGMSYSALGELRKSLNEHQQALKLLKIHFGDFKLTAATLNHIGNVYFRMGEYDAAEEKFQNAADLMAALFKGKHVVTANALSNLGDVYLAMEKYKKAYDSCKQALNIRMKLLGEHEDTATSFHSLGSICSKMNDSRTAVSCFQKASELRQKLLGDHLDTALSYHRLGEAQMLKGDTSDALASLQAALSIRENTLGFHLDTAATLELLGRAFEAVGQLCTTRALQIRRHVQLKQERNTDDHCATM